MTTLHTVSFQKTVLASLIGLCLSQSIFALENLEQLDDASLSQATGEGIALLPENFALQFNGADDTVGAGYIRYIPVGPLTTTAQDTNKDGSVNASDHSVGKADLYLYGVTLGQSKKDYGVGRNSADWGAAFGGISNTPAAADFGRPITSWGSAENPWLMKVATEQNVPDFAAATPTATSSGSVSYLMLEAPLYSANVAGLSAAEKSAYNLKIGFWADAFVRDQNKAEGNEDQFNLGQFYNTTAAAGTRANRLRLQAIWDGLGINGTSLKFFQTLGGATNTGGMSTSYNNTFGMAGVVRLNSGDGNTLRAVYNPGAASRTTGAWSGVLGECSQTLEAKCQFRFRERTVTDTQTGAVWTPPSATSVLRLSTRETSNSNKLATPALGGAMPIFNDGSDPLVDDGLYLYNANINLVLGSLYQPLTFGVAPDGKNLVFELARIPNKESIYKKIYIDYTGLDASYTGSTCTIYQCGNNGLAGYQGNNATHSSISIGSTEYNNGLLTAYKGVESVGVSFGQLAARTASDTITRYQVQYQQRQKATDTGIFTDRYTLIGGIASSTNDPFGGSSCGWYGECGRWVNRQGTAIYWTYLTSVNPTTGVKTWGNSDGYIANGANSAFGTPMAGGVGTRGDDTNNPGAPFVMGVGDCPGGNTSNANICRGLQANGNNYGNTDNGVYGVGSTLISPMADNLSWTYGTRSTWNTDGAYWFDASADNTARGIYTTQFPTKSVDPVPTNITGVNASALNNLGSAAIDGLLIQHMKITTKGL